MPIVEISRCDGMPIVEIRRCDGMLIVEIRWNLTISSVEIWSSYDHLISTMTIPVLTEYLYGIIALSKNELPVQLQNIAYL